jgi:hypothetical protein
MFYGQPFFTLINIGNIMFSLFLLVLLVIIPIAIYNLGSKLDRISRQLENLSNILKNNQA